jgi:LysM repeat protein
MGVRNLDMARNDIRLEKGQNQQHPRFHIRFVHVAAVLIGIILIFTVYVLRKGGEADGEKIREINKRLGDIEDRLNRIEGTEKSISSIDEQRTKFEISLMNRLDGLESLITKKEGTDIGTPDNLHREAEVKESDKKSEPIKDNEAGDNIRYHQVHAGETLYRISLKYGMTVEELRKLNKIAPEAVIYVGQKLIVSRTD